MERPTEGQGLRPAVAIALGCVLNLSNYGVARDISRLVYCPFMNWQEIANGVVNAFRNAGVKKDIIDLQEKQLGLLTKEIMTLESNKSDLLSEVTNLKNKIANLEQELQRLCPDAEQLNTVQKDFLKAIYQAGVPVALDYIASVLRIEYGMAEYHRDVLKDSEMIRWTGRTTEDFGHGLPTYELTPKGRAYLVENKLVSAGG